MSHTKSPHLYKQTFKEFLSPSSEDRKQIQKSNLPNSKNLSPYDFYCGSSAIPLNENQSDRSSGQIVFSSPEYQPHDSNEKEKVTYSDYKFKENQYPSLEQDHFQEPRIPYKELSGKGENQQPFQQTNKQMQQKMEVYYKSNPLNVIQEHWEQESRQSVIQDSQSLQNVLSSTDLNSIQKQKQQMHNQKQPSLSNQDKKIFQEQKKSFSSNAQSTPKSQHSQSRSENLDRYENMSKQEIRKEKIDAVKNRLRQLFLNYCDFSIDNGNVFITYINFMKLIKDAKILENNSLNQNTISIIVSKECNVTNNIVKTITFEQYLNIILRISEAKYPEIYKKYPKKALQKVLKQFVLPLLERIETSVLNAKEDQQNSLYSVSEMTLRLIIYNRDTQVIFTDILPIIKSIYLKYFDHEITAQKGKVDDLRKASLKSIMLFTRDFELCPYLIHQKACFLIWYSVAFSDSIAELCNNDQQKSIISQSMNQGKCFTLGHFLIFIYRLAVIYFNHSNEKAQEFNLVKKLLYFLRKLENSEGFKKFMVRLSRTYSETLTFLPSKDLLLQILRAEGFDEKQLSGFEDSDYITKEAIISRILDQHLYPPIQSQEYEDQADNFQIHEENEQFLQSSDDDLKKLFEIYCSFGEPMNTRYLKSGKLHKMMKDAGLLKGQSRLPSDASKQVQQVTHVDLDLTFKQVVFQKKSQGSNNFDAFQSFMSMGNGFDQSSHQVSGIMMFQSQIQSRLGIKHGSITPMQASTINKTFNFDGHNHLTDKNVNQHRLDFAQFKILVEQLSQKIIPNYPPTQAYVEVVKSFLIPLMKKNSDKRCIHNKKIQLLLTLLDSEEMIGVLTILHRSIIDIYRIYADNKGYMNFNQFIQFCSDHDIFPYQNTKASLYRIFHSLSFINEVLGQTLSKQASHLTSKLTLGRSVLSQTQLQVQQTELIDEHLFVEAIALCALFNDDQLANELELQEERKQSEQDEDVAFDKRKKLENIEDDTSELSTLEKVLQFIEKLSNSDGVHKRIKNSRDLSSSIKCSLLEKKDLLEPFRSKYSWYFKSRYETIEKKKNFQDIMEMSSMWTNASQIEQ